MPTMIEKVWVDETQVHAITTDGIEASYAIADWPRLADATPAQLQHFYLSYGGIHWPDVDEDLSFESMFHAAGHCAITEQEDSVCYDPQHISDAPKLVADESPLGVK